MKEEFQKSGYQTVADVVAEAVKVDIPTRKSAYTGQNYIAINWQKYLSKYWLPMLTATLFILQNSLGWRASVVLLIKTIIDYSWGGSADMRAPRKEDAGEK